MIFFSFIFAIRRLHDKNLNGWLSLLLLVPLINFFFCIYLSCAKGDIDSNNYGNPRITLGWEKILAWIYIICVPLVTIGVLAAIAIPAYQDYVERVQQMQLEQNINHSE